MRKRFLLKNNRLIIFSVMIIISISSMSQTIENWYVNLPDILNPTLTKQNRLELLEYHKAGKGDSIANRFGHQAYLLSLDTLQQQIVVKNTPSSTFEMKILNLDNGSSVLGIIRTVCAPVCLSSVEFYDTVWNVIPIQFNMPKAIEWVDLDSIPLKNLDINWVKNLMGISFISLRFSDKDQSIVAKNNTLDFISEEDRKVIAPYVSKKTISFELKDRIWQRRQ